MPLQNVDLLETANQLYDARNYKDALPIYEKLANQGYYGCARRLGWMYSLGEGVTPDDSKALFWLKLAAVNDDKEAMFAIGKLYLIQDNWIKAHDWFMSAAKKNYAPAAYRLGWMETRKGNVNASNEWLNKAAKYGNLRAERDLAIAYFRSDFNPLKRLLGLWKLAKVFTKALKISYTDPKDERLLF